MNWKEKMDMVVKDVLGIEYTCVVNSDYKFTIFENNHQIAVHETLRELNPHWRKQLTRVLETMYNQKIQKALSKV